LGMWELHIRHFQHYLKLERSLSANSIEADLRDVNLLARFMELRFKGTSPLKVSTAQLRQFLEHITDLGMSEYSQARILSGIRAFYKYLVFDELIDKDPTELLEGPRLGRKLPDTLSFHEI